MKSMRILAVLAAAIVAAACGSEESSWVGTVTDSAGVAIVVNPAEGMWGAAGGWTVEEELRIGALEGNPDYQFGQVGWIAVDSESRIFVLDMQAQQIKVFGADGQYERTMATRGGGPGELQGAMFVLMGPGDTLLVPDNANQRVNRYAPDGTSLGSFRMSFEDGIPMMFRATQSGTIAKQVRPLSLPGQPAVENPMDAIVTLAADGTVVDTLMSFESGETFKFSGAAPEFNIYSPEPVWDLNEAGNLLFAINDDYRINVYASGGELMQIVTKPFTRKPVSDRDKDAMMGFIERAWKDAGVPAQMIDQLRSAIHFGESFPAFASVVAGPEGSIWVQHVKVASELSEDEYESFNPIEDTGAADWDIFDSDGRFLGVLTMPSRFTPRVIRDDLIYGVWRDELDVQYVMKLKLIGHETT